MTERVCLIVDNPLRDLDGLILLGLQLSLAGVESWLVPMHAQQFDIPALRPDIVVSNYLRHNNKAALRAYKHQGALNVILDTEGVAGKSSEQFAQMVGSIDGASLVDLYCLWGPDQLHAFEDAALFPDTRLALTGCPRFDFCATPWKQCLPKTEMPGFVLINTNFPVVNSRYSKGVDDEIQAMIKAGFAPEFAQRFVADNHNAFGGMLETIRELAVRMPRQRFVVRPHPFESATAYTQLDLNNVVVRQEGTVLEWLRDASLLIHQNCSTAVEAVMIGVEAVSLDWLSTPVLALKGPTEVSRRSKNVDDVAAIIESVVSSTIAPPDDFIRGARQQTVNAFYGDIDGRAAQRVSAKLIEILGTRPNQIRQDNDPRPLESRLKALVRRLIGYSLLQQVKPAVKRQAQASKLFTAQQVQGRIESLCLAAGYPTVPGVYSDKAAFSASGKSVGIQALGS